MIEAEKVYAFPAAKPIRLKVEGKLVLNKKGEPKKFDSYFDAMSYGQRLLEKRNGNK